MLQGTGARGTGRCAHRRYRHVQLPVGSSRHIRGARGIGTRHQARHRHVGPRSRAVSIPAASRSDLLLVDQTDGVLKREFAGEKDADGADQALKLYIEAYGERAIDQPAPEGFAGTFMLEEALYAAPDGQTRGCDSPPQDYIVAARGNEPFWSAEVTEAALLWRQPDEPKEISIAAPQTQDSEGAVSYAAANTDHKVELLIEAQTCRDDMSGEYFAYSARATLDGQEIQRLRARRRQDVLISPFPQGTGQSRPLIVAGGYVGTANGTPGRSSAPTADR